VLTGVAEPWRMERESGERASKEVFRWDITAGLNDERGVLRRVLEGVPPPAWGVVGGGSAAWVRIGRGGGWVDAIIALPGVWAVKGVG
jgi:hypothetical protein